MQPEYLSRLSNPVQRFVLEVEEAAGVEINVVVDPKQDGGGTDGQGRLAVVPNAHDVTILVPTNGYFPDGAVTHEVLHVQRFHVQGVPKLALADEEWDIRYSDGLCELDNAIEHVVVVPEELQLHPERRDHWESVMRGVSAGLPDVPEEERRNAVGLHWTFLRHVLPDSPSVQIVRDFASRYALFEMADRFADQFIALMASKEELVSLIYRTFPEIPRNVAALEYINSRTGRRQKPIP